MPSDLWNHCLSQLENEYSETQLNTWIRPLQASQQGKKLHILAPNPFVLQRVQDNFMSRIRELVAAADQTGELQVDLDVGGGEAVQPSLPGGGDATLSHSIPGGSEPVHAPVTESAAFANPISGKPHDANLHPHFTFETLVEGKSNQIGHAAAMQIAENPGTAYNPFLIYGGSGLGKTHLMQAIGHHILATRPHARVLYINSESYVAEMVTALQKGRMAQFKGYYRNLDALLVDDIQFFAGKEQSQEEFFHNFNALFEGARQIVLTCDRYPTEIKGLAERLRTRFGWGLPVAIEPPELEMRVAILHTKAQQAGIELPNEVGFFIAKHIKRNVRELEGALRRVIASARFSGETISIDFAHRALDDLIQVQDKQVTIEQIQKTVSEYYRIRQTDLTGRSRSRSIAQPRQMAMSLSKELTSRSYPEIGKAFGDRDHTTVLHATRKIAELRESDNAIREDWQNLYRTLTL